MDAANMWKPAGYHPPCPVCAHRAAAAPPSPSVQRLSDGSSVDADVLRGASLVAAELELDEIPRIGADVVGILIPSLSTDDVIQIRIPRDCIDTAPLDSSDAHHPARRPANAVVLPERWYLIEASLPTIVSRTRSGCTRIEFDAPTDDATEIVLTIVRHSLEGSAVGLGA